MRRLSVGPLEVCREVFVPGHGRYRSVGVEKIAPRYDLKVKNMIAQAARKQGLDWKVQDIELAMKYVNPQEQDQEMDDDSDEDL